MVRKSRKHHPHRPSGMRFAAGAAGLWLAAGAALAQPAAPPPPPVTVAKPIVKQIAEWDDFIGRFEAVDQVELRARVSGYLDKVHFSDGALVKAGDALFTIDQRPYQAALEQADAQAKSAQARLDFAQSDLDRAEALRKSGSVAETVLDQRRSNFLAARADVDRAQGALAQAKLDLEFTEIKAPLAGRISRRLVSEGNLVQANQTVLTNIVSVDPIQFYFDVDERSFLAYSKMARNGGSAQEKEQQLKVQVAIGDERDPTREGKIDFVDNRLDAGSGTMRGRAVFLNADGALVPGLFGRIRLMGSDYYKGILVPDEAVGSDQDRRVVYVVEADNKVAMKPVRPGPRIDGYRVIRTGLDGSETIVVNGLMRVRPGLVIAPQMTTLPPTRERNGT